MKNPHIGGIQVTSSGPVPNRLPHDFCLKTIVLGNESRKDYLFDMIILTSAIVKERWCYLIGDRTLGNAINRLSQLWDLGYIWFGESAKLLKQTH